MNGDPRPIEAPWPLLPNRVSRFYRGGLLLDRFRGAPAPTDTNEPEDWVGSATRAWTRPGETATDEGLGNAQVAGRATSVADLLAAGPVAVAGSRLAAVGGTTGVLVKLLDAAIRLPVHAHPTRHFARTHLGSAFGKAEAWIVLDTRAIAGEPPPHVRLGFRRPVGREELGRWIDDEATESLLDALHVRETRPGDVWFVPAGTPHAIGAGVFILEIQEPTDFSIVAETRGFPIGPDDAHLGLGWNVTLDAIDRHALTSDDLDALRGHGLPEGTAGSARAALLPAAAEPFFRADWIRAEGAAAYWPDASTGPDQPTFAVAVVTAGTGSARTAGGQIGVSRGDAFAVTAAALPSLELTSDDGLEVIVCRPGTTSPEPLP